jgi:hypothetical protein
VWLGSMNTSLHEMGFTGLEVQKRQGFFDHLSDF